jgi:Protein of unknown function (DUF1071)
MLHINVNAHTERKNNLTYLSWAWAWAEALKADPAAMWEAVEYPQPDGTLAPCMYLQNGTAMVKVAVTVNNIRRVCMLPVMDHKNKAIPNPDAFAVNTAIMRCMTKALSMHGLGLYIYAGEDLPQADAPETAEQKAEREAWDKRCRELETFALDLIDAWVSGKESAAIDGWYDTQSWSADAEDKAEEQKFVWGLLKNESRMRSAIKANHPDRLKDAA